MGAENQQVNEYLLGVGHPLLDIAINVEDKFLSVLNLKPDEAILATAQHNGLIDYCFKNFDNKLKLIAGGATQNSIRTAQWVFDFYGQKRTFFLGTVGEDQYATILEKQARNDNVEPLYYKIKQNSTDETSILKNTEKIAEKKPQENKNQNAQIIEHQMKSVEDEIDSKKTGVCLAFNTNNGQYRSMITYLGAAKQLKASHLDEYEEHLKKSGLIYCGGFTLSSSFAAILKISTFCLEKNKKFALNLSAPYVCSNFGNLIEQLMPNLDFIFGNEKEFRELGNYFHFETEDLYEIAIKIFDKFQSQKKEQLIIITQNKDAVLCFDRSNRVGFKQYVPKIDKDEIVDTIGGGDAFAGGFLAYYFMGKGIDLCLKCGIYCARQIIKKSGCNFDDIKFNEQHVIDLFNPKN